MSVGWKSWWVVGTVAWACGTARGATGSELLQGSVAETVEVLAQRAVGFETEAVRRAMVEAAVRAADPRGRVLSEEDEAALADERAGRGPDVGLRLELTNGSVRVAEVVPDSPAARAGIQVGDKIEAIEGEEVKGWHHVRVLSALRGPLGETVHVLVRRPDESALEVDLARAMLPRRSVEVFEEWPVGVGYVRLNGLFEDGGVNDVLARLRAWAGSGVFGAVLDLRGAGGSDWKAAAELAGAAAESGAILFSVRDRDDQDRDVYRGSASGTLGLPLMVLVDGGTRGAAEVLAAALKHSVRGAMLVGTETAGDFNLREVVPLPASSAKVYLATRRLVMADGTRYAGERGVKPDIEVTGAGAAAASSAEVGKAVAGASPSPEALLRERLRGDAALERAVDVLLGLKALNLRTFGRTPDHKD